MGVRHEVSVHLGLLEIWQNCRGYYCTPREHGRICGPLVGYAGKYDAPDDTKKQYVGFEYFNFGKVEEIPDALEVFAQRLGDEVRHLKLDPTVLIGMPYGGWALAQALGRMLSCRVINLDKKVTQLPTETQREKSKLIFGRHDPPEPNSRVLLVEDVCNNFSTTAEALALLQEISRVTVIGIGCALNRSRKTTYETGDTTYQIVQAIFRTLPEYRQDDPEVAEEVEKNNVSWKPKDDWNRLMGFMPVSAAGNCP